MHTSSPPSGSRTQVCTDACPSRARAAPERIVPALLALGTLVVCAAALLAQAGECSMWLDELSVRCRFAARAWSELLSKPVSLSYILCRLFDSWFQSDWGVRLPLVAASLLVLGCTYALVARCGNRLMAWLAMVAVLLLPLFQRYSLMNRFYVQGTAMMLLAWLVALWAIRRGRAWHWGLYAITALLACQMWPWASPWVGFVSAYGGLRLIVRFARTARAERSWRQLLVSGGLICLPVVVFAIHYLSVPSIDAEIEYRIWHGEFPFDGAYVRRHLLDALQAMVALPAWLWLGLLGFSVLLVLVTRQVDVLAFGLITLATWRVAVWVCFDAQADPMPKRIIFVYINTLIVFFAGYAAGVHWLGQRLRRPWLVRRAWLRWCVAVILALAAVGILVRTHGERLTLAYHEQALDHGPPFDLYGALLAGNASSNAYVFLVEDEFGLRWGLDVYGLRAISNSITTKILWTRSTRLELTTDRIRNALYGHPEIWVLGRREHIAAAVLSNLAANAIEFPSTYSVWWRGANWPALTPASEAARMRTALARANARSPSPFVDHATYTNLLYALPDELLRARLGLLLSRTPDSRADTARFAELLSTNGLHAAARAVARLPLRYAPRTHDLYDACADLVARVRAGAPATEFRAYADLEEELRRQALAHDPRSATQAKLEALAEARSQAALRLADARGPTALWPSDARGTHFHALFTTHPATNRYALERPQGRFLEFKGTGVLSNYLVRDGYRPEHGRQLFWPERRPATEGSFSALAVINIETARFQVLVGRVEGNTRRDSPWFLCLFGSNALQFVVQFVDESGGAQELRCSGEWPADATGAWHVVAGVYNEAERTLALYLDGQPIAERAVPEGLRRSLVLTPLSIGSQLDGNLHLRGTLRECAVIARPVSADELELTLP